MDYVVLLKQVPKPKEMRVTAEGTLDRASAPSQINQDCQHALELALSLKDNYGGRVVVVLVLLCTARYHMNGRTTMF